MFPALRRAMPLLFFAVLSRNSLASPPVFPPDNPWNQRITAAPVAANSTAIINNIIANQGSNGRLHPDFGQDFQTPATPLYGIPYNIVHGNAVPHVLIVIDAYAPQSDIVAAPIPVTVILEGDMQAAPTVGVNVRGDSHCLIWDIDTNILYEFYRCSRPSENADGRWHADNESVWNLNTNSFRTLGWTSADAAGLPILPGLVRPDEGLPVAQGGAGVITHAIRFTLQNAIILDKYIYPGSHIANPGNLNAAIQPPMGSRFRLKASVDISALNPQSKVIAQAMKDYGLILADNGSNFFFSGASYSPDAGNQPALTWNDNDIQDTTHGLKSLHYADFEVVDLTPRITSLSAPSAAPGDTITITGQNFSGAGGHLQVLFGATLSPAVTFIDDTHVSAVVPSGSGTVNLRVQSGLTTAANPDNVIPTIFGYGLSPITAAASFTFSAATTGLCCRGATCNSTFTSSTSCASSLIPGQTAGARFIAAAATCSPTAGPPPCCPADYNKALGLTVQDIFDFLADWFAGSSYAITNSTGAPGPLAVQNIFDFLAAWFAGC
jgi:hypothetical protein